MQIFYVIFILFALCSASEAAKVAMRIKSHGALSKFYYCSRIKPSKSNRPNFIAFKDAQNPRNVQKVSVTSTRVFRRMTKTLRFCWRLKFKKFPDLSKGLYAVEYLNADKNEIEITGRHPHFVKITDSNVQKDSGIKATSKKAPVTGSFLSQAKRSNDYDWAQKGWVITTGPEKSSYVLPTMLLDYNFGKPQQYRASWDDVKNYLSHPFPYFGKNVFTPTSAWRENPGFAGYSMHGVLKDLEGKPVTVELMRYHAISFYTVYFRFKDGHVVGVKHNEPTASVSAARAMGKFALTKSEIYGEPAKADDQMVVETVEGESLFSYSKRDDVDIAMAKKIWKDAILRAHANSVLVGDIRSSNIVVDSNGVGHVARYLHSMVLPFSKELASEKLAMEMGLLDLLIDANHFEEPNMSPVRGMTRNQYNYAIGSLKSVKDAVDGIGEWLLRPKSDKAFGILTRLQF